MKEIGAITGIGETRYRKSLPNSGLELQLDASLAAIVDAGLTPREIDGIIIYPSSAVAEDFITNFGIEDLRYTATMGLGGASAVASIQSALAVIHAGLCRHVLVSIGRSLRSAGRIAQRAHVMPQIRPQNEFESPFGVHIPAQFYGFMARRHMELYGTSSRHFAEIAVAGRGHALLNDNAIMRTPISIEDHQSSEMISDPFRLLDCCLENDGGAAFVVSRAEEACDMRARPVFVTGVAEGHAESPMSITQREDMISLGVGKAAPRAFKMAGVEPADIDVAEIYDCFTYIVLAQLEALGFCSVGEGGDFVRDGRIALGGALPVNTHGGLLSQSNVAGFNHIAELVRQMRGEAGSAQVAHAQLGLVTGYGTLGDGSVAIMRRA